MMVVGLLSTTPTATPGFWRSYIRKIRSSSAINVWFGECHRAIRVSEAHYSGGCHNDSPHDAMHLSTDSCLCEGLIQKHLTLRVERRTVVDKSDYSLSAFPKKHLYTPLKGEDVVPATLCRPRAGRVPAACRPRAGRVPAACRPEPSLCSGYVAHQSSHQAPCHDGRHQLVGVTQEADCSVVPESSRGPFL